MLRCIGKGSYGEVWLARNVFGAFRAVKVVRRSSFDSDRPFQREFNGIKRFEPVSRSHPAFMAILHVGENQAEGYFYYVMELADDQQAGQRVEADTYEAKTISTEIATRGRLPFTETIQVGIAIGDALATLHTAGLVHRDIKPANIIYVNGRPKLADIGLVHTIASAATFVGTQGYIPPEGPGTVQADIYALGKLLYEVSTGNDRQQFPELPDFLASSEDGTSFRELNEVLVRACESNPKDRYTSATLLCSDLQLIGRGESLQRLRQLERRWKVATRFGAIAGVVILVLGGLGWVVVTQHQRTARARASQAATALASGTRSLDEADNLAALPWFVEARDADGAGRSGPDHRLRIGSVFEYSPHLVHCWWHTQQVRYADFSPDGKLIAFSDEAGGIGILNWRGGVQTAHLQYGTEGFIMSLEFSRDGLRLVAAGRDMGWRVWDVTNGGLICDVAMDPGARYATFSPDGAHVVTAGIDGYVTIWNATNGARVRQLRGHLAAVRSAVFSPDGSQIVSASHDSTTIIWDAASGAIRHRFRDEGWMYIAAFSADGKWIVNGGSDSVAQILSVAQEAPVFGLLQHPRHVCGARFSPDQRMLATVTYGGSVHLWDLTRHAAAAGVLRHSQDAYHAGFSPDSRYLVTSSFDKTVRVWDVGPASSLPALIKAPVSENGAVIFDVQRRGVRAVDLVTSNSVAETEASYPVDGVVCNFSGSAFLMKPALEATNQVAEGIDWNRKQSLKAPAEVVQSGKCVLAEGATVAVSFNGGSVASWDLLSGTQLGRWPMPSSVGGVAVSSNGTAIIAWPAIESRTKDAWLIHVGNGGKVLVLEHELPVVTARFDGAGDLLVTGCRDNTMAHGYAQVWDAHTGNAVGAPMRHTDGVTAVALSEDGEWVATGGEDNVAFIWNRTTGRRTGPLRHQEQVWSVTFVPGTSWLTTGAADGAARVWDIRSGTPLTPMLRQPGAIKVARVAGNGRELVTTGGSGSRIFTLQVETDPSTPVELATRFLSGEPLTNAADREAISRWAERSQKRERMTALEWHKQEGARSFENHHGVIFHYERVVTLGGGTPEIYAAIAAAKAELNDLQGAVKWMSRAAKEQPKTSFLNSLAALQLLCGDTNALADTTKKIAAMRVNFAADLDTCWTLVLMPQMFENEAIDSAFKALLSLPVKKDSLPLMGMLCALRDTNACMDMQECVQVLGAGATAECHAALAVLFAQSGHVEPARMALNAAEIARFTASGWQRRARISTLVQFAEGALQSTTRRASK